MKPEQAEIKYIELLHSFDGNKMDQNWCRII